MHSLSSSRQVTQVSSWLYYTCSSNSFPPHPFAFPLVSSLAFAASFLPPVFISIFLNFLGYARGKYLVCNIRSCHIYFQGQCFLYFFLFVCSIVLVILLALDVFVFSAFLSLLLFLQPLPGFQSHRGV